MWYCAHALHYFEYKDGKQDEYFVWEHMYLIQARTPEEALSKGEVRGKKDEVYSDDEDLRLNERKVRLRFITVRKVVECQDLDEDSETPIDGTELSYSEYSVSSKKDFEKLIHGKTANVDYIGREGE